MTAVEVHSLVVIVLDRNPVLMEFVAVSQLLLVLRKAGRVALCLMVVKLSHVVAQVVLVPTISATMVFAKH